MYMYALSLSSILDNPTLSHLVRDVNKKNKKSLPGRIPPGSNNCSGYAAEGQAERRGESAPGNGSAANNYSGYISPESPDPGLDKPDHPEPDPEQFFGLFARNIESRPDSG